MVKSMTRLMFLGLLPWLVTSPAHGQFAVGAVAPGVGGGAFGAGVGGFGFGQAGSLGITGAGSSGVGLGFGSPGYGMGMGYGGYPYGARPVAPGLMYPPMTSRTTNVLGPLSQSIRRNVFPRRRR
jgi:hypothetical protein